MMSMSSSSTASFMSSSSMSSAPSSGKTKTDQVVLEFFYKAVEMILQARGPKLSANKEARQRRARFNLDVEEIQLIRNYLVFWKSDPHAPLYLDIFWDHPEQSKILLERWSIHYPKEQNYEEEFQLPNPRNNNVISELRVVCKRIGVLLRALYSFIRLMPAQRLYERSMGTSSSERLGFCIHEGHNGEEIVSRGGISRRKLPPDDDQFHHLTSGLEFPDDLAVNNYSFVEIDTPFGLLKLSVAYRRECSFAVEIPMTRNLSMDNCIINDYVPSPPPSSGGHLLAGANVNTIIIGSSAGHRDKNQPSKPSYASPEFMSSPTEDYSRSRPVAIPTSNRSTDTTPIEAHQVGRSQPIQIESSSPHPHISSMNDHKGSQRPSSSTDHQKKMQSHSYDDSNHLNQHHSPHPGNHAAPFGYGNIKNEDDGEPENTRHPASSKSIMQMHKLRKQQQQQQLQHHHHHHHHHGQERQGIVFKDEHIDSSTPPPPTPPFSHQRLSPNTVSSPVMMPIFKNSPPFQSNPSSSIHYQVHHDQESSPPSWGFMNTSRRTDTTSVSNERSTTKSSSISSTTTNSNSVDNASAKEHDDDDDEFLPFALTDDDSSSGMFAGRQHHSPFSSSLHDDPSPSLTRPVLSLGSFVQEMKNAPSFAAVENQQQQSSNEHQQEPSRVVPIEQYDIELEHFRQFVSEFETLSGS